MVADHQGVEDQGGVNRTTGHFAAVQTPELFAGLINEFLDASGA
jgi:hypothetical protein